METDYKDEAGHQIPVEFESRRSVLPFNLASGIKNTIRHFLGK